MRLSSDPGLAGTQQPVARWDAPLVIGLTIAAALLRLTFLAQYPAGLQGDEAWLGLEAQRILSDGPIGFWSWTGWGQPAGVFYWTALFFRIFPQDVVTLRLSIAILGVATVPAFYLFARSFYGRRAAVIGTTLLAFSYWHIYYSRTAYTLISAPLVEVGVLFFLGKGLRERRAWPFVVAGALAGLGVYTYRGYMFFVAILVVAWGAALLQRPYPWRQILKHALLFAVPAALLAAPMGWYIVTRYSDYAGYGNVTSVFNNGQLRDAFHNGGGLQFIGYKLGRAVAVYYYGGGADITDGLGAQPLLDPLAGALLAVGLVVSARRWRRWEYVLLPAGVAIGVLATAMTIEWGENRRGIAALPMVFAAAGVGGDAAIGFVQRRAGRLRPLCERLLRPRTALAVVSLGVVVVVGWNVGMYFGNTGRAEPERFAYNYNLARVSEFLESARQVMDGPPHVYFYSDRWALDYEALRFLVPGLHGEDRSIEHGELSFNAGPQERLMYLLLPPYDRYMDELRRRYPNGLYVEEKEGGRVLFAAYFPDGVKATPEGKPARHGGVQYELGPIAD